MLSIKRSMLERDPLTLDSVTTACRHLSTYKDSQVIWNRIGCERKAGCCLTNQLYRRRVPARPPACRHDLFWPRQDINVGMKNVAVGPTWRPCLTLTIRKHSHVVTDTHPGLRHWILSGEDFSDC